MKGKTILWTVVAVGAAVGLYYWFFTRREVKATVGIVEEDVRIGPWTRGKAAAPADPDGLLETTW